MRETTLTPALERFLERHGVAALNIGGILRNQPGVEIFVDDVENPEGVLVRAPHFCYVHTEQDDFLEQVLAAMSQEPAIHSFSGVWGPLAGKLKARFPLLWDAPCDLYHLPEDVCPPPCTNPLVRTIDPQDAEVIDEHYTYRNPNSLEKIRDCIRNRPSSAVYVDGRIVSWLLVHEDDSMGIMFTLEEHRRKGYGVDVTLDLVAKQRARGRTPFVQIRTNNEMSPGLARKCGFVRHGSCDWFGLVVGTPPEFIENGIRFRRHPLQSCAPPESLVEGPGFRAILPGIPGGEFVLEVKDPTSRLAEIRELARRRGADPLWITTPLDDSVQALAEAGDLKEERERECLCRLLHEIREETAGNPVDETTEDEAWLAFCARSLDPRPLRSALAHGRKAFCLLWERRGGEILAAAALLVDEHDDCALVCHTRADLGFLRHVLQRARSMQLDLCFAFVEPSERAAFEAVGFKSLYTEAQYRMG